MIRTVEAHWPMTGAGRKKTRHGLSSSRRSTRAGALAGSVRVDQSEDLTYRLLQHICSERIAPSTPSPFGSSTSNG